MATITMLTLPISWFSAIYLTDPQTTPIIVLQYMNCIHGNRYQAQKTVT